MSTPAQRLRIFWPIFTATVCAVPAVTLARWFDISSEGLPLALPIGAMTFGIVVSGFVATQRNMLLTMTGSEVLRFLVRTEYYVDTIDLLMDCIYVGLLFTVTAAAGLLVVAFTEPGYQEAWLCVIIWMAALVVFLVGRNERLMAKIVGHYMREQNRDERAA